MLWSCPICAQIAAAVRADASGGPDNPAHLKLQRENADLRRANRGLCADLDLDLAIAIAIASIQRLSIDNHRLTEALESASGITRLPPRPR